ncbi:hypothetical protein [Hydrogenimonas sp.]
MRSRGAFTLLEVLLSVLLLFTMGLALLKFDGWVKNELTRYRAKAAILANETPLLYTSPLQLKRGRISLYDVTNFLKLRDDEIFWLKGLEGRAIVGKERKKSLFQSGDLDLTYRYVPIRLERGDAAVPFVRLLP